jgi:chorismate dehydratase
MTTHKTTTDEVPAGGKRLRVGALSFINALPFFYPFLQAGPPCEEDITYGTPTHINALLEADALDVGLISSANFLAHRDRYILLTNLGIGATKRVMSVCLYTRTPVHELSGKTIGISSASATSAMLLKVLCRHFWKVSPQFIETQATSIEHVAACFDSFLLIGDECLTHPVLDGFEVIDMAEAWYRYTEKPFVFAVFATRCDAWVELPEKVRAFHRKLDAAWECSLHDSGMLLEEARRRTKLPLEHLRSYYDQLDFQLNPSHFQGMEHFARLQQ